MYLFDTSSLSQLFYCYRDIFPSLWGKIDIAIQDGVILSVMECRLELDDNPKASDEDYMWLNNHKNIFLKAEAEEISFIKNELFTEKNGHFQALVPKEKKLEGKESADPFLIAKAKLYNYFIVTEESEKGKPGSKIPHACQHFSIEYCNLHGFMKKLNWRF